MNSLVQSSVFADWLSKLADDVGKAHILRRITSAELGNFGDCKAISEGVSEMRIHYGPGYRVYFTRQGGMIHILLCAGLKRDQKRDVKRARKMARELKGNQQ